MNNNFGHKIASYRFPFWNKKCNKKKMKQKPQKVYYTGVKYIICNNLHVVIEFMA